MVAAAAVATSSLVGAPPAAAASAAVRVATARVSTRTLLSQLTGAGEHAAGYRRTAFQLWVDADHDRCTTRAEVLLTEARTMPRRSAGCALRGGTWVSPYDGRAFTGSSGLDIDHLVPLAEAWQSGAYRWDADTRKRYANDLGYAASLVAVSAHANRSKGDKEPQRWLPSRSTCSYVARWVAVKWRWRLQVDTTEKSYLAKKLSGCRWPKVTTPSRPVIRTAGNSFTGRTSHTPRSAGSLPRSTASTSAWWSRSVWSAYERAKRLSAMSRLSPLPTYPAIIEAPLVRAWPLASRRPQMPA
jgi:hypothetical protein